jgi:hypothetical protein
VERVQSCKSNLNLLFIRAMKFFKLAFEFLPRFKSKYKSACAMVHRDDSSIIILSTIFTVCIKKFGQITVEQGLLGWHCGRARAPARRHTRAASTRRRRRTTADHGSPCVTCDGVGLPRAPRDDTSAGGATKATWRVRAPAASPSPTAHAHRGPGRRTAT